ncbi:MAG TPA: NUDIX domain-containing protein [Ignavibacteria bacterium]|nr:NUDIX domain-containing protein [Ignavibacteria bacterium]
MKLATLLYIKNGDGEYLLMERLKEPNKGLMSPPGGKLDLSEAESPSACAVREAFEECSIRSKEEDWELRGIITEKNFPKVGNIMIFLMEYKKQLNVIPPACNEGEFRFIDYKDISRYKIPVTDEHFLWDKIINSGNGIFEMTLDCTNYPDIIQK